MRGGDAYPARRLKRPADGRTRPRLGFPNMSRPATLAPETGIRPRVKVWLELDGESVCCSGLARILEAIRETGSIKEASTKVDLSYRHVWSRIKQAEAALGFALVHSQVGGGTSRRTALSPAGETLLATFLDLRSRLTRASDECGQALRKSLREIGH
jgi:molybdate transport system regulatory protein